MSNYVLNAKARDVAGKGASRRLRRLDDTVPAIVYGGSAEPTNLTIDHDELLHLTEDNQFFSSIINLNVDGKEERVIIKDLQRHPAKPVLLHADFQRVTNGRTITIKVPVRFENEAASPASKVGGKVFTLVSEVKVVCKPENLPEFVTVDLSNVELGQNLYLSDIVCPEGVEVAALRLGKDHNQAVARVVAKRK
ncbi:50S ribosomal protein L25 [Pokkaliibacter plantistimulans]|uniref:Large ribosomal subunit protein bL25 n=1 Tax=Pokkaliibacter plantistimulans TaxID=1635171 RepID=A0ABX5LQA8_9GAMM|nr:50S ribosomal protein L25/general stress protein Ctc [Pokkaliibacter plantistimulans]PXF28855.1 50S ribosomal protein L25 [Pokkaliibacter plantistimulans]